MEVIDFVANNENQHSTEREQGQARAVINAATLIYLTVNSEQTLHSQSSQTQLKSQKRIGVLLKNCVCRIQSIKIKELQSD